MLGQDSPHIVITSILEDLRERGGDWYDALEEISGTDPIPGSVTGDIREIKAAWLDWGRHSGYLRD
ncbi:MAG TPA: hypothetical protein VI789_01540 [Dehalococcoidia bacterium]|nr:hypothetical protein [Dehalococcoidia bacterium]